MKISVSNVKFKTKPKNKEEYKKLTFRTIEIQNDADALLDVFTNGNALAFIYKDSEFPHQGHYKLENYVGTDFLIIDADHCGDYDWIKTLNPSPTLWTTTFSASETDCRCHIVYALSETLYGTAAYNALWDDITSSYPREADKYARSPKRLFHTTNRELPNFKCEWIGGVLNVSAFRDIVTEEKSHVSKVYAKGEDMDVKIDEGFLADYNEMSRKDFLQKYCDMIKFDRKTAVEFNGELYVNMEGKDFFQVKDKVEWKDGKARKKIIREGERDAYFFVDARQFLYANEGMTIEELIYVMTLEVDLFYDNSDGELDNYWIISRLSRIYHDYKEGRIYGVKTKRKAVINNELFKFLYPNLKPIDRVHKVTRDITDERIARIIDTSLTLEENLKLLKKNNLNIKKERFIQFLEKNDIHLDTKKDRIKKLLKEKGEGLSLREKVRLCKEHGLDVSVKTLKNLEEESVSETGICTLYSRKHKQSAQVPDRDTPISTYTLMSEMPTTHVSLGSNNPSL